MATDRVSEPDIVELLRHLTECGLQEGDVGMVVQVYREGATLEEIAGRGRATPT